MTTIKEHLEAIEAHMTTSAAEECREHLAAIEAKLDAPMRSVDSWAEPWEQISTDRPDMLGENLRGFIRAIQADAVASKQPDVDRPMKSAESWADQFPNLSVLLQDGDKKEAVRFIEAIQNDVQLNNRPDVDLRQLAYETMSNVMDQFQSFVAEIKVADGFTIYKRVENIIHAAFLKARGEK